MNYPELIEVVAGDSLPDIRVQLRDDNTGLPVDVSAADKTVKGRLRAQGGTATLDELTATKVDGGYDGWVLFTWGANTLDLDAGRYELQVYIDAGGSAYHTATNLVKFRVKEKFAAP